MAIELFEGNKCTKQTDVWAFGMTVYVRPVFSLFFPRHLFSF